MGKLQGNVCSAVSLSVINFLLFNMCAQWVYKYIYIYTHGCMYSQSREKEKLEECEGVLSQLPEPGLGGLPGSVVFGAWNMSGLTKL